MTLSGQELSKNIYKLKKIIVFAVNSIHTYCFGFFLKATSPVHLFIPRSSRPFPKHQKSLEPFFPKFSTCYLQPTCTACHFSMRERVTIVYYLTYSNFYNNYSLIAGGAWRPLSTPKCSPSFPSSPRAHKMPPKCTRSRKWPKFLK